MRQNLEILQNQIKTSLKLSLIDFYDITSQSNEEYMKTFKMIAILYLLMVVQCNASEIITFKGIPFDIPGVKGALQKICQEDSSNGKTEYSEDECLFKKSKTLIWLSYGIQSKALGWITLSNDNSLLEVEIHGSKNEMLAQVEILSAKYGNPIKTTTQVENGMGTKFDKEIFTWVDSRGSRITIESMYNKIDEGRLVIESPFYVAAKKAAIKQLEEASKNNL